MVKQIIVTGGLKVRSLNGYLIAVNGEVYATTNTGGTTDAFFYKAKTTITSGDPTNGHLIWNNATQISATQLNVSHLTSAPVEDIDLFLSAIVSGNKLVVQDRNESINYQSWTVSGTPTQVGSTYWTIPVTFLESSGTGTTGFANNHNLLFAIISGGTGGGGITTNAVTFNNSGSGAASGTSFNGATAVTVSYNTFGAQQASASLSSLAGLSYASGTPFVKMTAAGTFSLDTNTYLTANQTITLSGDGSGSGTTAITFTLATVNSNVGTFNNVTVNAKGLVTSASNVSYLTANQTITLSGNVTGSGTTSITTTIGTNVVTNAMLAQIATARIKGRVTAGTGNVEDLTGTQVTTLLDNFTSALKGLAPASGGGTTNFLRADGTWAAPAGGGGISGSGTTNTIPIFTGSTTLGDSYITQSSSRINYGTNFGATPHQYHRFFTQNTLANSIGRSSGIDLYATSSSAYSEVRLRPFTDAQLGAGWTHNVVIEAYNGSGNNFQDALRVTAAGIDTIVNINVNGIDVPFGGSTERPATLSLNSGSVSWQFNVTRGNPATNTWMDVREAGTTRMRYISGGRFLLNTTTDNAVDTLQVNGSLIATSLKITAGTSSQILAADGSVITAGTGITISGGTISSTGGGGGTTTNAVTFNNGGTGDASGTTFDGSAARTISYNTLGANKVITSGTAAPTGGVDGDIYLQYV
jgi:hypothetical protein